MKINFKNKIHKFSMIILIAQDILFISNNSNTKISVNKMIIILVEINNYINLAGLVKLISMISLNLPHLLLCKLCTMINTLWKIIKLTGINKSNLVTNKINNNKLK